MFEFFFFRFGDSILLYYREITMIYGLQQLYFETYGSLDFFQNKYFLKMCIIAYLFTTILLITLTQHRIHQIQASQFLSIIVHFFLLILIIKKMLKAETSQNASNQKMQIKLQQNQDIGHKPQLQTLKKPKPQKKVNQKGTSTTKMGHWNFQQKLRYVIFVENNAQAFTNEPLSKLWKLFKQMSQFINTRDPYQCRSHHQKMLVKFYSVDDMIECLKSYFSQGTLRKSQRRYLEWLTTEPQEKSVVPKVLQTLTPPIKSQLQEKSQVREKCSKAPQSNEVIKDNKQQNQFCYQESSQTAKMLLNELHILEQLYRRQLMLNSILSGRASYNFQFKSTD